MSYRTRGQRLGTTVALGLALALCGAPTAAAQTADSNSCTTGHNADGFVGPTYVKLRVQQVSLQETWVCFRAFIPGSTDIGGRIDVLSGSAQVNPPTDDAQYLACEATSGQRPHISGNTGDPGHPDYVPWRLATYADASQAWVCLQAGGVEKRVIIPQSGATPPNVIVHNDAPTVPDPDKQAIPGYPSSTCHADTNRTRIADFETDWARLSAAFSRPTDTRANLCVRVGAPVNIGGMLSLDATGSPGVTLIHQTEDDNASAFCPRTVVTVVDPVELAVKRSPDGQANPVSLCVKYRDPQTSELIERRVTLGTSGNVVLPEPTWTPDPGSPGLPGL